VPAASEPSEANGRSKRVTDSAPLGTPTRAIPVVSAPEDARLSMRSVELQRAPSEGISDAAAVVRPPPPRKREEADMAALVSRPLSSGTGDLPDFSYPTKKSNRLGWILALLAMAALGFGAVVLILPKLMSNGAGSTAAPTPPGPVTPPTTEPIAAVTIDAQLVAEVAPDPEPVVAPDPTPTPPDPIPTRDGKTTGKTTATSGKTSGTKTTGGAAKQTPVTSPDTAKTGQGSGSAAVEVPDPEPPVSPPITDSDCDEVACVLSKYARPCCAKYRPATSDIKPRGAGGLPTELDKAAVRAGMATVKPAVVACGEKSGDKGTVKIAMKVKADGAVESASVASAPSDALGACVATALRKAQFAKTVNGGSFTYPFAF
jgi:hypothetical protein